MAWSKLWPTGTSARNCCIAKEDCSALMVNYTNCEMKDNMGSCCSSLRSELKFPVEWKDDKVFRSAGVPASHIISNLSDNLAWKGQSFQVWIILLFFRLDLLFYDRRKVHGSFLSSRQTSFRPVKVIWMFQQRWRYQLSFPQVLLYCCYDTHLALRHSVKCSEISYD
jgi:hypothetical protein